MAGYEGFIGYTGDGESWRLSVMSHTVLDICM